MKRLITPAKQAQFDRDVLLYSDYKQMLANGSMKTEAHRILRQKYNIENIYPSLRRMQKAEADNQLPV